MTNIQILDSRDILGKTVTAYGTVENPLFNPAEVAEWLEYRKSNIFQMLQSVDEDEKVQIEVPTLDSLDSNESKKQGNLRTKRWFLTEFGLYETLMLSKKPQAKAFKREVKKLLRNIRTAKLKVSAPPPPPPQSLSIDGVPINVPAGVPFSVTRSKTGVMTVRVKTPLPVTPRHKPKDVSPPVDPSPFIVTPASETTPPLIVYPAYKEFPRDKKNRYKAEISKFGTQKQVDVANNTLACLFHAHGNWLKVSDVAVNSGMGSLIGCARVKYYRILNALIDRNLIERSGQCIRLVLPQKGKITVEAMAHVADEPGNNVETA